METLNKNGLSRIVAEETGLDRQTAANAINSVFDAIVGHVTAGGKVTLVGFGTFKRIQHAARKGRNPQNGKEIMIPAKKTPVFKAGKDFKNEVDAGE